MKCLYDKIFENSMKIKSYFALFTIMVLSCGVQLTGVDIKGENKNEKNIFYYNFDNGFSNISVVWSYSRFYY